MCLITLKENCFKAIEDKVVYKVFSVIDGRLMSPYQCMVYELNHLYENKEDKEVCECGFNNSHVSINGGYYHSFISSKRAKDLVDCYRNTKLNLKVYLGIIPKGTKYYIDFDIEEIASRAIKIISEIEI